MEVTSLSLGLYNGRNPSTFFTGSCEGPVSRSLAHSSVFSWPFFHLALSHSCFCLECLSFTGLTSGSLGLTLGGRSICPLYSTQSPSPTRSLDYLHTYLCHLLLSWDGTCVPGGQGTSLLSSLLSFVCQQGPLLYPFDSCVLSAQR
jgi:hypothetical protein